MQANPVVHFEMSYIDGKRMSDFYAQAFGWESNQLGADMGHYIVTMTGESTKTGPVKPGYINGGFYKRDESKTDQYPSFVISVDDINAAIEKIKSAGGTMLNEPMPIPGVGTFASFKDTEGNRVSILQPMMPKN